MFRKIMVANRGEIAVRIIRACREAGIQTVAVYSAADTDALHVRMADEAYAIGEAPSRESYLRGGRIIRAALESGSEAIHPGYGFLAENAEFARNVTDSGIVFIGPPTAALKTMGGKLSAREVAIRADVPVVPGSEGAVTSLPEARDVAAELGYPVMIKASAGGGGKGMRLVLSESELGTALETARSEAASSFGDGSVYVEKWIETPRHIEIQVFADSMGNYVHLGERECSIQRRHQKVIEESPSPLNDPELRSEMGACAIRIAREVGYIGAGTVEFLVSGVDRTFYFLEMNTRLQVEHPVTEYVTGIDIVKEQIRVAAGERLSFSQEQVVLRGHSIECRIYAEDPDNDFFPSPGTITFLRIPGGPGVRDDGGVTEGGEVPIHYDPLISKLCVYGRDRSEAIGRMKRALREYRITGIKTTLPLYRKIMDDKAFRDGELHTGFLKEFGERSAALPDTRETDHRAFVVAALAFLERPGQRRDPEETEISRWALEGRLKNRRRMRRG